MSLAVPELRRLPGRAARRLPGRAALDPAAVRARSVRRRVSLAWGLLFFNTLTYNGTSLLDLPSKVGKGMAQGALPLAIVIALTVNPKIKIRPNVFLCIVGLLVADAVITATQIHTWGRCSGPFGSLSTSRPCGC